MTTITLEGTPFNTIGKLPPLGSQAPDFIVTKTDLSEIRLKNYLGKKIVMNIFPSLDTQTCENAMLHFNEIGTKSPDSLILCISADLPFAQKRLCSDKHLLNVQPVSVFRHPNFGEDYGVTIIDGPLTGLLSRAIVILDEHGKIIYTQQVKELTNEPDYDAIIKVLTQRAKISHE